MSRIALIDGDMIAYRCAASCHPSQKKARDLGVPFETLEVEPLEEGIFRTNDILHRIIDSCAAEEYRVFLSGGRNYRKLLYQGYKAHRADVPKPTHLDSLRELLVREWQAEICDGYEADDGIGMAHSERAIIVSNDKDFKQIAGEHYNPVKDEFEVVDETMAAFYFYHQMLKGDAADNIRGVDGIGEVRATRLLSGLTPEEMHSVVMRSYDDEKLFLLNYSLLRILRSIEDYYEITAGLDETPEREGERQELTEEGSIRDSREVSTVDQE